MQYCRAFLIITEGPSKSDVPIGTSLTVLLVGLFYYAGAVMGVIGCKKHFCMDDTGVLLIVEMCCYGV